MNVFPLRRTIGEVYRVSAAVILPACLIMSGLLTGPMLEAQKAGAAADGKPAIVQPGAPGQPTKVLPPTTHATLPPISRADVEFMQGMIMHHSQALEMTALIPSHTENTDVRSIGARISSSQADEIRMMQRWLAIRGQATSMQMSAMPAMDMSGEEMPMMPGMLSPVQMDALRRSRGPEFDRLFLSGMIQHHGGALVMVRELFNSAGAGQDAEIFNFSTDVDNSQRAEIRIMQKLLEELH